MQHVIESDVASPSNHPARLGRFTAGQIAQRSTWSSFPDIGQRANSMVAIHIVPAGATTITTVNVLDPATAADVHGDEAGWLDPPASYGPLYRIRPAWWMA